MNRAEDKTKAQKNLERTLWVRPELIDLSVLDTASKIRNRPCEGCNAMGNPAMGAMAPTNNGPS